VFRSWEKKKRPGKKAAGSANGRQATLCGVARIGLAERAEADQRRYELEDSSGRDRI